jgi:peptidoglycan-associated lipoprotein
MTRSRYALICAALALTFVAPGCAKRPSMNQAAAPPPVSGPVAVAPAAPAATPPASTPAAPPASAPAETAPVTTARPAPTDFVPAPQMQDIYFDFDKSAIRPDAARVLQASAEWLTAHADRTLLIEGHCDERGTEQYNLALGDRRAKAAMDFLAAHGVAARRITVVSYGEQRPQCTGHDEQCWGRNRRAHFGVKAE